MIFSSTLFLFLFLPIVITAYFLIAQKYRNFLLLIASLFFYAWGEQILVLLMIGSICVNYAIGNIITEFQKKGRENSARSFLVIGIIVNLSLLGYYKYINFFFEGLSQLGLDLNIEIAKVKLPIGISFFTFQSISYLVDVYRKIVTGQRSLINLGMYISLFPQLIAGPIVRYADISKEIESRKISTSLFQEGITRFIGGFAKKVLIANNVGLIADSVFAVPIGELSTLLSWIGIICYALQIYYDFSGYSDMAIGLGKMFGFNFKENFEHPYISTSIREFWRRWHISLSSWFRDYLYIPLGGNRKGKYRTYINLIIVFFLTGLWHGASWNFVVWGLYHGVFLMIERFNIVKISSKMNILKRIYTLLVLLVGWVIFRSESISSGMHYIGKLFSCSGGTNNYPYLLINNYIITIIFLGVLFSMPLRKFIEMRLGAIINNEMIISALKQGLCVVVFILSIMELAQSTYNPFIYFRF